jgi:hypothetical protein
MLTQTTVKDGTKGFLIRGFVIISLLIKSFLVIVVLVKGLFVKGFLDAQVRRRALGFN